MKVGKSVKYLLPVVNKDRAYAHPMDDILYQIQHRRRKYPSSIKLRHAFSCLIIIVIYLTVL